MSSGAGGRTDGQPDAGRLLPHGRRDALVQVGVWAGFAGCYEAVRGLTSSDRVAALAHAHTIIRLEQGLHAFFEPALQRDVVTSHLVTDLADWTYWLAQFAVLGAVVIWVYLRRNDAYARLRDTLILTNTIGLAGYLLFPVAPPRLVAGYGFRDTLVVFGTLTNHSGIVRLFANPYAAFPSLHAADGLVLGVAVFRVAGSRAVKLVALLWPVWVAFCLILSANHFWLDIAAGFTAGLIGILLVTWGEERVRRRLRRISSA